MKKILIIITQANAMHLTTNESLSVVMVLSTFGHQVQVLLQGAALSLLNPNLTFHAQHMPFKVASNMVESFEFYDLLPILVEEEQRNSIFVQNSPYEIEFVSIHAGLIQSYDHVLYW